MHLKRPPKKREQSGTKVFTYVFFCYLFLLFSIIFKNAVELNGKAKHRYSNSEEQRTEKHKGIY